MALTSSLAITGPTVKLSISLSFFDSSKCLDAGIFTPEIQLSVLWYTMATDVVFGSVEHALAYVAVKIWVVVIYYPLSLGYRLRVCEGMVVGGNP